MSIVHVYPDPLYPAAKIRLEAREWPAVIGKSGAVPAETKKEGDGATPQGIFALGKVYVRRSAVPALTHALGHQTTPITPDLVWCDEPTHPLYNQPTTRSQLGARASHEKMWRPDHLYNIVVVVEYNRPHPISGKGSAIFIHVARNQEKPRLTPTRGCIALRQADLLALLARIHSPARVHIH